MILDLSTQHSVRISNWLNNPFIAWNCNCHKTNKALSSSQKIIPQKPGDNIPRDATEHDISKWFWARLDRFLMLQQYFRTISIEFE